VSSSENPERKRHTRLSDAEWAARHVARERQKIIGLLLIALLILALAFLRFGKTIPWAAR